MTIVSTGIRKLGLLYCVDGVKAFQKGDVSLAPAEFIVLNLPPKDRYCPKNMLLHMLLPTNLHCSRQSKYYDFAVDHELQSLFTIGLPRTRITFVPHYRLTVGICFVSIPCTVVSNKQSHLNYISVCRFGLGAGASYIQL